MPLLSGAGSFPPLESFMRCASSLRRARILTGDFENVLALAQSGDFVYLDPPYAKTNGRFRGEYGYQSFADSDMTRLLIALEQLDTRGVKFLLSYSYCDATQPALYKWDSKTFFVKGQVAGFTKQRTRRREVLVAIFHLRQSLASKQH